MMNRQVLVVSVVAAVVIAVSAYALNSSLPTTQDEPDFSEPVFDGARITIHTDKLEYNLGEVVRYTIASIGTETAWFGNTALSFHIEDLSGDVIYSPIAGDAMTDLPPGKQRHGGWGQIDFFGRLVSTGTYVAVTGGLKSEPFTIIHDESAYPGLVFEEGRHLSVMTDKYEYQVGEPVRYTVINTGTENIRYDSIPFLYYVKNHLGEIVHEIPNKISRDADPHYIKPYDLRGSVWDQNIRAFPDERHSCNFRVCWDTAPRGPYLENIGDLYGQQVPAGTYVIVVYGWWESPPFTIK